jgi:hypothetical protein
MSGGPPNLGYRSPTEEEGETPVKVSVAVKEVAIVEAAIEVPKAAAIEVPIVIAGTAETAPGKTPGIVAITGIGPSRGRGQAPSGRGYQHRHRRVTHY